jgi:hypothetical protein
MALLCPFAQPKKTHFAGVKIFIYNKDILALGIIKILSAFLFLLVNFV